MKVDPKDDLDRVIDEALASMVGGEPRRVSAASVRQAMGESRRSSLPVWLALAAVLIVALAVVLKERAPAAPVGVAQSIPSPVEVRSAPSSEPSPESHTPPAPGLRRRMVATTTEPVYEGLPRLTIASIDLPEALRTSQIDADPIQIPRIEIAPLAVSSLSNEPERK